MTNRSPALAALDLLVGEWSMAARFDHLPTPDADARVAFEWLAGEPVPRRALDDRHPRGTGRDRDHRPGPFEPGRYLQHYFDSRGVARVYKMTLADNVWRLWRDEADFSPLDFRQRYTGTVSDDGRTITGSWEICHDDGTTWEHDFDLTYVKVS